MAVAGAVLIRRRLRQRFGIAAGKVSVRSELPWYWRALVWTTVLSVVAAASAGLYDAGRRFAAPDRPDAEWELMRLREQVGALEAELEKLRGVAQSSDSRLQVETTTQGQLSIQVKTLQRENAALKEDLASFESLVVGGAPVGGLRIARASVDASPTTPGAWRYRVLIVNPASSRNGRESNGELQFEFSVRQHGKDVNITFPKAGDDQGQLRFSVKHFQRVEGELTVPLGAVLKAGEVRLLHEGAVGARYVLGG